jgi:hypothetical protein
VGGGDFGGAVGFEGVGEGARGDGGLWALFCANVKWASMVVLRWVEGLTGEDGCCVCYYVFVGD